MPKNILIFSDGTSNDSGGITSKPKAELDPFGGYSNVFRLYLASRPEGNPSISESKQIAFYDPGLGSVEEELQPDVEIAAPGLAGLVPKRLYSLLSKATGLGITRNIRDCYGFIAKNYEQGDRIYLFGFSRGAYTVRSLGGLLGLLGVPKAEYMQDEKAVRQIISDSVELYKKRKETELQRAAKEKCVEGVLHKYIPVSPHVIAVFDTVRSLGFMPIVDTVFSKWAANWVERLAPHKFHDHMLGTGVKFAFHAISIDENRWHFDITPWEDNPDAPGSQMVEQAWFPGVHSDVGGAYADTEDGRGRDLGRLSLRWMVNQLKEPGVGLIIEEARLDLNRGSKQYHLGIRHDERKKHRWPLGYRCGHARGIAVDPDPPIRAPGNCIIEASKLFEEDMKYRPEALRWHHRFRNRFSVARLERCGCAYCKEHGQGPD